MTKQFRFAVIISGSRYAVCDDIIFKRKNGKLFYWFDDYPTSLTEKMTGTRIKMQVFVDGEVLILYENGREANMSIGRKPSKWGVDITESETKKMIRGMKIMKYKIFNNIQDAVKESKKIASRKLKI